MSAQALLIPKTRTCVCCERSATPLHRQAGEPNIMAVCMTVYRKGGGELGSRAAPKVQVCEECFIKAVASSIFGGTSKEGKSLLLGVRQSLSECYSSLVDDDPDPEAA